MMSLPRPGEIYRHFRNNLYQVIAIATHTETKEKMVVYQALYKDFGVYVRPLSLFMSEVDRNKYPDCVQKYRFQKVNLSDGVENNGGPVSCGKIDTPTAPQQTEQVKEEQPAANPDVNPDLMAFLDAETYTQKIEVLARLKNTIDEELLQTIAVALDYPLGEGSFADQYESVLYYLETHARYEGNRLR